MRAICINPFRLCLLTLALVAGTAPKISAADPTYVWQNVTNNAGFAGRDGAGALVYDNKLWLLGGWNPNDKTNFPKVTNNEVWNSSNGAAWTRIKANTYVDGSYDPATHWEGRHTAGYVVHDQKMWIIGGDANQGHYQDDIWNSTNGTSWTKVNGNVPWGPRVLHHTLVHDDKIWVMGGQTLPQFASAPEAFYNDVWNSSDGINWNQVEVNGPLWGARGAIGGSVVFHGRMWVLGGGTYWTPQTPETLYNDVWSSADGANWTKHVSDAPWRTRKYHSVAVFDDRMWVIGGYGEGELQDVWHSSDGINWTEVANTPWSARHAASVYVYDDALWVVAGSRMQPDVWKLTAVPEPAGLAPLAAGAIVCLQRRRSAR